MYNFTHNNHFKFGYGGEWFRYREPDDERFEVTYGACERVPGNFIEECHATARLIRDSTSGPLTVLFSGGSESEIVVRSFTDQRIPITAAICQFNDNLNMHDISYAVVCCEQLKVPYKLVPLDIMSFLDDEKYLAYVEPLKLTLPELASTMWLADQVDGIPIIGTGECYIAKRVPPGYVNGKSPYDPTPWDMYEREHVMTWYRYFMMKERMAIPGFFRYTPEIILSFLKDDTVIDLVNDRMPGKRSTSTSKIDIYRKYFPLAARRKYNGYERIRSKMLNLRRTKMREKFPYSRNAFLTEYNDLVGILEGRLTGPRGTVKTLWKPKL